MVVARSAAMAEETMATEIATMAKEIEVAIAAKVAINALLAIETVAMAKDKEATTITRATTVLRNIVAKDKAAAMAATVIAKLASESQSQYLNENHSMQNIFIDLLI